MNNFEEKHYKGVENDLKLKYCGKRLNNLSHSYGPHNRDSYLIYYIKEGTATLVSNDDKKIISAHGFYVNFPHSQNIYYSTEGIKWSIKWIVVEGDIVEKYLKTMGITRDNPYIQLKDDLEIEMVFDEMYENFDKNNLSSKFYCISLFHKLFSLLAENSNITNNKNSYVLKAEKIIENSFSDPEFNVNILAKKLGIHHNYFSIIYKKETGISPIKAINAYRMKNACKMLKFTDKSIKSIANECGYIDEFYFSRAFSKLFNKSPREYRQNEKYLI